MDLVSFVQTPASVAAQAVEQQEISEEEFQWDAYFDERYGSDEGDDWFYSWEMPALDSPDADPEIVRGFRQTLLKKARKAEWEEIRRDRENAGRAIVEQRLWQARNLDRLIHPERYEIYEDEELLF